MSTLGAATELPHLPRPPKVSELLADRLRASILGQGMQPGDVLSSEVELISRYGVARGTVREALRLLEADGLIEIKRGRSGGILVREPDLRQLSRSVGVWLAMRETPLRQMMDFRLLFEPAAAAAAAESATPEQRQELLSLVHSDDESELEHAADFHSAIALASNNDLLSVCASMLHQGLSWEVSEERLAPPDLALTHEAHVKIVRAIIEGDPARASRAMQRHLEDSIETFEHAGRLSEEIMPRRAWQRRE